MDMTGMVRPGDVQDGVLESLMETVKLLLKNTAEAMFILNEDGLIRLVNPEARHLTGCSEEDLVGKPVWMIEGSFITPEKLDVLSWAGASVQYETVQSFVGRRKITLEVRISLLRNNEEGLRGFICLVRDITGYREAEERLKEWIVQQNEITLNREERIVDLKQEVNRLLEEQNRDRRYCA